MLLRLPHQPFKTTFVMNQSRLDDLLSEFFKLKKPKNFSDLFALSMIKFFRFVADTFFAKRYGHRAVVWSAGYG